MEPTFSFRLGVTLVGIKGLNHVINAMILLFTISAANSDLYIASRTLYGLAIERKAPQIFAKVNKRGVPWVSLLVVSSFICLTFLNASTSSSTGELYLASDLASIHSGTSIRIWSQPPFCVWGHYLDDNCL
jgi:amino acid transporter